MEVGDNNLSSKGAYDYILVQLALSKGDQKAYAELMGRYRESLYFMLLKMVNNKDDADDLTIEVFGKAFKSLHQYTPNFAFSTWLFKIATNNCIDFMRKKRVNYSLDKPMDNEEGTGMSINIKADDPDPEQHIIKKEKVKMMREVVDKLKPHYKQLVEMRYFEELSYEEISKILNLPIGTVKAQLFRARELLQHILMKMDH